MIIISRVTPPLATLVCPPLLFLFLYPSPPLWIGKTMQGPATHPGRLLLTLAFTLAVAAQHDHGHSHHGEVKTKWDEEEYLKWNPPTPPSYWSEDTRTRMNPEEDLPDRHPRLMVLHVVFMCGAFFVALPAGESL